jgi:hypothetical protein
MLCAQEIGSFSSLALAEEMNGSRWKKEVE